MKPNAKWRRACLRPAGPLICQKRLKGLRMDVPSIETIDGELIPTEQARRQSKRLFLFGFAFLPLLWFCNVWLFWHDFMGRPGADAEIKKREQACYPPHAAVNSHSLSLSLTPQTRDIRRYRLSLPALYSSPGSFSMSPAANTSSVLKYITPSM